LFVLERDWRPARSFAHAVIARKLDDRASLSRAPASDERDLLWSDPRIRSTGRRSG